MPDPVQVIANPNAAGGRGRRAIPRLRRVLAERGIPYHVEVTRGPGHARELASNLGGDRSSTLLVVGGDGTLHEVANGLLEADPGHPRIALVPVGTGNDFHRMTRAPAKLTQVVELVRSGAEREFDMGRARWEGGGAHFINLLGMGIDVEVLRTRTRFRRLPGLFQYGAALLVAGLRYRHLPLAVEWEGGPDPAGSGRSESDSLLTAVTIGPTIGGGFRVSPAARPDDGLLDVCEVGDIGFLGLLRHIPRVIRGTHGSIPQVRMQQVHRLRIESRDGRPIHFELDGELMPRPSPWIEIDIAPERLRVLEPQGGPRREPGGEASGHPTSVREARG